MIRIGMGTTCVYPLGLEQAFRLARLAGFDGVEIMVTQERATQSADVLRKLSATYGIPILSIHAPVLVLTQFVWGTDPGVKLEKSAELAREVGAETVVVHPPFRWQGAYSERFLDLVSSVADRSGVQIAVENMFPWKVSRMSMKAYKPGWDPSVMDCDSVTLDFSHAALSGMDTADFASRLGPRLRHIHLCDGSGSVAEGHIFDEHLLPGRGTQPVAQVLQTLASASWNGTVVAEVNTRSAKSESQRMDLLLETLAFARTHTRVRRRTNSTT